MIIRKIHQLGVPVLRQVCEPVSAIDQSVVELLDDMIETLFATPNGAGLAAPQVGVARRIVVMDCGNGLIELINPVIVEKEGEQTGPEACLSMVGLVGTVKRADRVKAKAFDRSGQEFMIESDGFLARCIQHELDHLDGILFIDHVPEGQLYDETAGRPMDVQEAVKLSNKRE
jgi:peptide deformylase